MTAPVVLITGGLTGIDRAAAFALAFAFAQQHAKKALRKSGHSQVKRLCPIH